MDDFLTYFITNITNIFLTLITGPTQNEIEAILTKKSDTKMFEIDDKDKVYLANNLREACLPKMLCEIAAKPAYAITEKEKSLLDLIKYVFFFWWTAVRVIADVSGGFFLRKCTRKHIVFTNKNELFSPFQQF